VLQWIEIENRAMEFLRSFGKEQDCFTLHSPVELNDKEKVQSLLEFLGLPRRGQEIALKGSKNRTPGVETEISTRDREEFAEAVSRLPEVYRGIFRQAPYSQFEWARTLSA